MHSLLEVTNTLKTALHSFGLSLSMSSQQAFPTPHQSQYPLFLHSEKQLSPACLKGSWIGASQLLPEPTTIFKLSMSSWNPLRS